MARVGRIRIEGINGIGDHVAEQFDTPEMRVALGLEPVIISSEPRKRSSDVTIAKALLPMDHAIVAEVSNDPTFYVESPEPHESVLGDTSYFHSLKYES